MTSSFYETLGRATDAPPDISKTNYLQTTPDMSKAVNENIDDIQKSWDAHYDQMIEIYKHIHKQKTPAENLLQVMKQGKKFKEEYDTWQEWYKPYSELSKEISKRLKPIKEKYGDDPAAYLEAVRSIIDDDPDVKKENEIEGEALASRVEGNAAGYNLSKSDSQLSNAILNGPRGIHEMDVDRAIDLKQLINGVPGWEDKSDEGIKHHLDSFGYTAEGEPIYKSVNEATEPEDKYELRMRNIAWYVYLNQDAARGRFGKYKKDFIVDLVERQESWKKTVLDDYSTASLEIITDRNNKELYAKVEKDPKEFINQILLHTNHPEFLDSKGNVSHKLVLDRYFEKLEDGIRKGEFQNVDAFIKALGEVEFQAFGHKQGHLVKIKDHWKKRFVKLEAAGKEYYDQDAKEKKNRTELNQGKDQKDIVEFCANNPGDKCKARIAAYKTKWNIGDEETLPANLKNALNVGDEPEENQIERLEFIKLRRPLTKDDIKGLIPGTPAYDKYLKEIEQRLSVGSVQEGPGSIKFRNRAIMAQVALSLNLQVEQTKGNPKATLRLEKAEALYNSAYYQAKQFDINISNAAAHQEAMEQVKGILFGPDATDKSFERDFSDEELGRVAVRVRNSIIKNTDLLNNSEPLEGEEPYIQLGAKYLNNYKNNKGGTAPKYYSSLAAKLQMDVNKLIRTRLEAVGMLKEGEIVFPQEGKPGERLLVNSTASRTMRVYNKQLAEDGNKLDIEWMLEQSKSPTAIANGGYLSVSDKEGNYTNIEKAVGKPMEAITMGDIINLMADGYTGFGIFEIPSYQLREIIETNGIPRDMIFDQDGQDFLYLAALRNKASKAQRYTGVVTDYRRLVNIDKNLHNKFNEIAGDLVRGKPWLDLNNLAPEVAKDFIEALTQ